MSEEQFSESSPEKRSDKDLRYVPVDYVQHRGFEDDEIDLISLAKTLWNDRKLIYGITILFAFLGLFIFLFAERQYESDAILIQEQRQTNGGAAQLLRQLGGGDITRSQQEGIPPGIYPDIIESADFLLGVVNHEVEFETLGRSTTAMDYFNYHYEPPVTEKTADFLVDYTVKLPVTLYRDIRNLFQTDTEPVDDLPVTDDRFLSLSSQERRAIGHMRGRISIEMDGSLVTIKVQMPDKQASAELNHFVIDRIQEYVINYRIERYRQNLNFVEKQKDEAQERYEEAQLELARFSDRNVNITTAVARTHLEDLQNRRDITYNVYNTLAQEMEQARIRLQEETPVFNVLQKPSLPTSLSNRSVLPFVAMIIFGGIVGVASVFAKKMYRAFMLAVRE